jgi:hypothetical protein
MERSTERPRLVADTNALAVYGLLLGMLSLLLIGGLTTRPASGEAMRADSLSTLATYAQERKP